MIAIQRTEAPEFLSSQKVLNAKEKLKERFENKNLQSRMRFDTFILQKIKPELMKMCNNKCAYCESHLGITGFGDVDNFRPKSGTKGLNGEYYKFHYWWLAYEWDNLLMSCQICNQRYKKNLFPIKYKTKRAKVYDNGDTLDNESALLIDPCRDNPEEHLTYITSGRISSLTERGEVTIKLLGLNRRDLVNTRKNERLNLKNRLQELSRSYNSGDKKTLHKIIEYIHELLSENPTQPYAGILRYEFNEWLEKNKDLWANINEIEVDEVAVKSKQKVDHREMQKVTKFRSSYQRLKQFSIKSVEIKNFKAIGNLTLNLDEGNKKNENESWFLLLGDNGIGKSSILQAIALCLTGRKKLEKLNLNVKHFLKYGTNDGFVKIRGYGKNSTIHLSFDENGFKLNRANPVCFTMGYGSTRLLPKGSLQPEQNKTPYINILNLFDYSVSLENTSTWLNHIGKKEFHNRIAPALIDLLLLDSDDKLSLKDDKIYITHWDEEYPLEQMSDGYKSVAGLALDIMYTLSIERADYHDSSGIVFIDEVGSHLHPRWKIRIIKALKKAFPRLQFIVTSHEPLCLRGLEKGEVGVLVRDENKNVQLLDAKLLPDHTMMTLEQLLTSDLFGLINVMDENIIKKYEDYAKLLKKENKIETDKKEMEDLSQSISDNELIGATPAQQTHFELLNKEYVQKILNEGYQVKELKEETKEEAQNIINKKNLGWL